MAYDFEVAEEAGILVARVRGIRHARLADNFNELWAFWSSIASEMKTRGIHRLLAVVTATGTLRTLDVRTFYRRLAEMGFLAHMRLAIVMEIPLHERPVVQLGVGAAAQDGWNIRLCLSEAEAKAWLLSE